MTELDLRLESDDIDSDLVYRNIQARQPVEAISAVVLRTRQIKAILRTESDTAALHSLFGIPVVRREDDLTPRERSIQRALAEFPPTRDEQVAEALKQEDDATLRDVGDSVTVAHTVTLPF